jgi:uncharacterized protein
MTNQLAPTSPSAYGDLGDGMTARLLRDGMAIYVDVPITTDDGVVLRADVFLPEAGGQHPVVMTYGPYAKGLHFEDGYRAVSEMLFAAHPDVPANSTNAYQAWEVVDPEKWVPEGYACVRVDSRGTGSSPGVIDCYSARETRDYYECIEWAGTQPWSTGKVGLCGISYYASNQWHVAALAPPHLTAMIPWEGANDWYREGAYHGGIRCTFGDLWYRHQVESVQHGRGERAQRSRVTGRSVAGDLTLSNDELAVRRVDFGERIRQEPLDSGWYDERSADLEKITVPFLSAANWGGHGLHLRGNCEGFVRASSPQKWIEFHGLEHWTHFYTDYGRALQLEFFDHFLKCADNGWDRRPPVLLNVRHPGDIFVAREEQAWPLPDTRWTRLYLDAQTTSLSAQPPAEAGQVSYRGFGSGVTFKVILEENLEISGPLAAKLRISSDTADADLFLVLRAFDPNGKEVAFAGAVQTHQPVAHGWLRASHRKLDPERSQPWRPWHSHDERQPLVPGQAYDLDVEIWPTSLALPAGYTLALTVQGKDYQPDDPEEPENWAGWYAMRGIGCFAHDDPSDRPAAVFDGSVTVHTGGPDSYLLLPIIPNRG